MPEPGASPRLIKFVRRTLRRNPKPTFEEVLERWRGATREDVDPAQMQTVYDEEMARALEPPPRDPKQTQIVLVSIGVWIVANGAIALALSLPTYVSCRRFSSNCGLNLGLVFLLVGVAQVVVGVLAGLIALRIRQPVAQGIFIGLSIVLVLFTVLCFGATANG